MTAVSKPCVPEYLGLTELELSAVGASATAQEISQQPALWAELLTEFEQHGQGLQDWLSAILQPSYVRIIFTGAGTSAYIGQALAAYIQPRLRSGQQALSIATTDLVSHPELYLAGDAPVLLISYARSGNSPESVAAADLVKQLHPQSHHLVISCNADGQLAQRAQQDKQAKLWLMPAGSNDQSFAMTSSYSCMMLATLLLFGAQSQDVARMIEQSTLLLQQKVSVLRQWAQQPCQRMVFLGSGPLQAVARELALKYLELTAGKLTSFYETPLGFRHGPKSLVDAETQIVILDAQQAYSRRYDLDLHHELCQDQQALSVQLCSELLAAEFMPDDDIWLCFPYAICGQVLAFFKAIELQVSPDNPCPSGLVNRVVQGVHIHPLLTK
ncbi:MAG: SIS domain-containing protein [Alkalimonas sp.]|nr:SIS domain-containing protein [Alkalimonas sp.]